MKTRLSSPLSLLLLTSVVFVSAHRSQAFDNLGHEVVAQIAHDTLVKTSPVVAAKLDAIVSADPRPLRQDLLICAIWPDLNKHRNQVTNAPLALFANAPVIGEWHFVDIPFEMTSATAISNFVNMPGVKPNPHKPSTSGNVVTAIRFYSSLLKASMKASSHATARDRADYVSWITHFVGDVHQPLHCVNVDVLNIRGGKAILTFAKAAESCRQAMR